MRVTAASAALLSTFLFILSAVGASEVRAEGDYVAMTPTQLKSNISSSHPSAYYILASKLLAAGKRDEAVVWFYAGQLRYRFHLAAHPGLPADGDPALFASLSEVVGRPINEYAAGNVEGWSEAMQQALDWDEQHENRFTSKTVYAEQWRQQRAGLVKLRNRVRGEADEIRGQRQKNGLENR
ncbi:hypothetical protein [Phyllobacterium zundukense]|uniref:Uncharacterized protein n=1 Tax=Phyllobacterium zundukense TaxID=1867719 RepID=A0ACD4CXG5_9HYPH|nr:hypothetical protein [Phyllobacterium zundukense]UXN58143.1 hypothetical protein N8E88_04785 [Phyllobacterium zundukense]